MHSYQEMKSKHSRQVSKTLDEPIMFLDKWDLQDMSLCLGVILVFGVFLFNWSAMFILLIVSLTWIPKIKKENNKGVFMHWAYKNLKLNLIGFINPKQRKRFSD